MPPFGARRDDLDARSREALAERGFGTDILALIDNVLDHEPGPPPRTPRLVGELLSRPLAAADAEALFRRSVPRELALFDDPPDRQGAATLDELIAEYVGELVAARALLHASAGSAAPDAAAIRKLLDNDFEPVAPLVALARTDEPRLRQATARFVRATARFVSRLRAAGSSLHFPDQPRRFASPIGLIEIGTRVDEQHGGDAALIVDPGGDDRYERRPLAGGGVSVVVDLAGNDIYSGSDVAINGLGAIVDLSGDDRYESTGAGLAAVIFGASLLVDFSGSDVYRSGPFGGLGLLWDRAGNDRYRAGGMEDAYGRGGGVSFAQGAAFGLRNMLAGGIGILRDDAGDDAYEAQMFAQGTGYFYGLGLLWDSSGKDDYRAVRYAQGNGVHQAVGVLREESGDDRYELSYGVGQGMGLDLSVGVLYDAAGDDRYSATVYAQGSATDNGIGVLFDAAGADEWHMSNDPRAWGRTEPSRRLPSLGLLLYRPQKAVFLREGKIVPAPGGGMPIDVSPSSSERRCPAPTDAAPKAGPKSFADAVRSLEFLFRDGSGEPGTRAYVERRLRTDLQAALAELPGDEFVIVWVIGKLLPCAMRQAAPPDATAMWAAMERVLAADPASRFAGSIAVALRERPAPSAQLHRMIDALLRHPSCAVRSAALTLDGSAPAAQAALRSSCWLLQASALRTLRKLGVSPDPDAQLPSFLHAGRSPATSSR